MAGVNDRALKSLGSWPLGIANAVREDRLPQDENGVARALREADNVDLDASGTPRRRRGTTAAYAGTNMHSLWGDPNCPFALVVDDGALHTVDIAGDLASLGLGVGNSPLSCALIGDRVYLSNRVVSAMVDADLQVHAWAPEHPAGQPELAPATGLGLAAGQYQVAVTFVDVLGRESGTGAAATVDVPADGGVALTGIPQPVAALAVNVYMTDANDQVLRLHSVLPAGVTTATIGTEAQGRVLGTQFLSPMPAGQIVRLFNGRQLVADGQYLRWSPPMRYGMTDRRSAVIRFNAPIDLLEAPGSGAQGSGVFVAAGARTYWLAGADPEAWEPRIRRGCGAVPGAAAHVPGAALGLEDGAEALVWLARDGQLVVGAQGGTVMATREGTAAIDDAERAALLFRAEGGMQQVVAALRGPRPQAMAVRDRAVAHVIYEDPTPTP